MNKCNQHIILTGLFILFSLCIKQEIFAQFTIEPGSFVTLKEGGSLMIGTDFHIKSVADSSGYFADQTAGGDVTITGDINVERYLTPDVWHNVASPVSNETSGCYTGTDLVFWYDEPMIWNDWNFGWVWYYGATGGPLTVFRGYDVYIPDNAITVNYLATGSETLNTGPYSMTVTNSDPFPNPEEIDPLHKGWNLAGNPYPSPVDWLASSGWNKSAINDAKYIWNGIDSIYSTFIGGSSPHGVNGGTRLIPSNQGFWVRREIEGTSGTLSINNACRIGDITGTPDFYKDAPVDYPLVSLLATGNGKSDETIIRFIPGTSAGFDLNFDASKLLSPSPNVPQVSVKTGKKLLALDTYPELTDNLEVLLDFRCGKAGTYRLSLSAITNLDAFTKVFLKDEILQKIVCLSTDSSYVFYHDPGNDKNRFRIYFNPSGDIINNIKPENRFSVYSHDNQITIIRNITSEVKGIIVVYNMLGQAVWQQDIGNDNTTTIQPGGSPGYYIVSIVMEDHICNAKVMISN